MRIAQTIPTIPANAITSCSFDMRLNGPEPVGGSALAPRTSIVDAPPAGGSGTTGGALNTPSAQRDGPHNGDRSLAKTAWAVALASRVAAATADVPWGTGVTVVARAVLVTEATAVRVETAVAVRTGVCDGAGVCDGGGVSVGNGVCVGVSVAVAVGVRVGVGVGVGGQIVTQPPWSDVGSGVPSASAVSTR